MRMSRGPVTLSADASGRFEGDAFITYEFQINIRAVVTFEELKL